MSVVVAEGQQHDVTSEAGLLSFYNAAFEGVYRSAARLTWGDGALAEDLVQDAFVRLVRSIQSGAVTTVGIGWMITTVRRIHIDGLRARDREDRRIGVVAATPSQPPSVEAPKSLGGLLDGLSERERTALILRYVEDLSVAEVADLMGDSTRATESLLQRAKRRVRDNRSAS